MRGTLWGALVAIGLLVGCGDDDGGTDAGTDAANDSAVDSTVNDTGSDVATDSSAPMTITVRAVRGGPDEPLEGLNVYVDEEMVGTTDAAGEAEVTLTPNQAVTVEYTGARTTYSSLVSYEGPLYRDGDVYLLLVVVPREDRDLITLSGTITNAPAETTIYALEADVNGSLSSIGGGGASPDWEISLPRQEGDVAIVLSTAEDVDDPMPSPRGFQRQYGVGGVAMFDATTDQSDLVVDLSVDESPLIAVSGSFSTPSGDFFDVAAANMLLRTSLFNSAAIGAPSRIFFDDATESFQWVGVHVDIEPGVAQFFLSQGPRFSQVVVEGNGAGDLGELDFLPPPNVTTPGFGESVSPGDMIVFDNVPTTAQIDLFLSNDDDEVTWVVAAGGAASFAMPTLPAGATVLDGDNVRFRPRYCELGTVNGEVACVALSAGAAFDAAP